MATVAVSARPPSAISASPSSYGSPELILQRFGVTPTLTFSSHNVGDAASQTLIIRNPNSYEFSCEIIAGRAEKHGFTVATTSIRPIPALGCSSIIIEWSPRDLSAVRVQLQFQATGVDESRRPVKLLLAVTLLGSIVSLVSVGVWALLSPCAYLSTNPSL
jgi:hypothetical protein